MVPSVEFTKGDKISQKSPFLFCRLNRFYDLCRPKFRPIMARVCQVTGKRPVSGNSISHSNIKTKRRFLPNLQKKRFFLAEEDKWITLKVSSEGLRTINNRGLLTVVKELRANGEKI
jgi:large subunit ribosomal protein L28